MEHIKRKKPKRFMKDGTPIGDLEDYKALMQDYGRLRAGAGSDLKPFGFDMTGSPREKAKQRKASIIDRITDYIAPPTPPAPKASQPEPSPPKEKPKKGLGGKLFGWLPKGKRR